MKTTKKLTKKVNFVELENGMKIKVEEWENKVNEKFRLTLVNADGEKLEVVKCNAAKYNEKMNYLMCFANEVDIEDNEEELIYETTIDKDKESNNNTIKEEVKEAIKEVEEELNEQVTIDEVLARDNKKEKEETKQEEVKEEESKKETVVDKAKRIAKEAVATVGAAAVVVIGAAVGAIGVAVDVVTNFGKKLFGKLFNR